MRRILVPVDGSPSSNSAAGFAARLASETGAELVLMHVADTPAADVMELAGIDKQHIDHAIEEVEPGAFDAAEARIRRTPGVSFERHFTTGNPASEIVAFARDGGFDLIVMGSHGRPALTELVLGSVSHRVIQRAPCPVTIVREPNDERSTP